MNTNLINNDAYFQQLRSRPEIAWPTVIQLFVSLFTIAAVWYTVLSDIIPLWAGVIINIIAYYFLFSPIHDGLHRAISINENTNDFFTNLAMVPVSFLMGGGAWARMFHMQHHRHTGKEVLDPDLEISSKGSHAMWKWFIWGFHYSAYYQKYKDRLPTVKPGPWNKTRVVISLVFFGYLLFNFPLEFIFLWLVPTYAGISWMTAFVFSFLPHHLHKRTEGADPLDDYQATCNIVGFEWLLSPIMQYQNYHLVHHLYPTVPFYRYVKIWRAHQDEHYSHNPAEIKLAGK